MGEVKLERMHFIGEPWSTIEPYYRDLQAAHLTAASVQDWLRAWSEVAARVDETNRRLEVATTVNTADTEAERLYHLFLDDVQPRVSETEQHLKELLLASGLEPRGFEIPLRKMRADAALFRSSNLPLLSDVKKLAESYHRVRGAQTVEWDGQVVPTLALHPVLQETDRTRREQAWRTQAQRELQDTAAIGQIWRDLLQTRRQIAANAGLQSYRDYAWLEMKRFDYSPADAQRFHEAVESVVVPAAARIMDRRRGAFGVPQLRPWDLFVDPEGRDPLRPYTDTDDLLAGISRIFHAVDPQLGSHFDIMRADNLLDLDTRENKAQVGYCLPFNASRLPFIFLNLVGTHGSLVGLFHEGGHAFHTFETAHLPYLQQRDLETIGIEFSEVGSTAMEFLTLPYLARDRGGFYDAAESARATVEYLENTIIDWCRIAVIDAFQHWIYEHPDEAMDADALDAQFGALQQRFIVGVDWSGLEVERARSWHNVPHVFEAPFYYIEYGLAQLGAAQIWANALRDQAATVHQYRQALQLGDTRSVPDLYRAAGARFAFDADTLGQSVALIEDTVGGLRARA